MMSCDEAHVLLHGLLDAELDPSKTREVEAHVGGCPRCAAELRQFREMRAAMRDERMTFAAPAALRSRIEAAIAPAPVVRAVAVPSRRWLLQGFALGSALSAAAAVGIVAVVTRSAQDDRLLGDVVSAHLRSLQSSHLTDVAAADRKALLPWFSGKVAVAPPVIDLAAKGFTLVGGRLDFLDGKPAAAMVYRRGAHVINLFVAAASTTGHVAAKAETAQGFSLQRWSDQGMRFIAISDLGADELKEFHTQFETALRAG
jgi:anti-sigma factor RsiW